MSGFLGKAFWGGHPFLAGALDDFGVYDTALGAADVAALAGSHLATITDADAVQTAFAVTTTTGSTPALPSSAIGTEPGWTARVCGPGRRLVRGCAWRCRGGFRSATTIPAPPL